MAHRSANNTRQSVAQAGEGATDKQGQSLRTMVESHGKLPTQPNHTEDYDVIRVEDDFAIRYCTTNHTKSGRIFGEFVVFPGRRLKVGKFKNDTLNVKEFHLSAADLVEFKRLVLDSEIMKEHDTHWPTPDHAGHQELDITCNNEDWFGKTANVGSLTEVEASDDPVGLKAFYQLILKLRALVSRVIAAEGDGDETIENLTTDIGNDRPESVVSSAIAKKAACKSHAKIREAERIIAKLTPIGQAAARKRLLLADDLLTTAATELDNLKLSDEDRHMRKKLLREIETIGQVVQEKQGLDWSTPLPTTIRSV